MAVFLFNLPMNWKKKKHRSVHVIGHSVPVGFRIRGKFELKIGRRERNIG